MLGPLLETREINIVVTDPVCTFVHLFFNESTDINKTVICIY